MVKKKEVPLTKVERNWEAVKRSVITTLAVLIGTICLQYVGLDLSEKSVFAIATLVVTYIWKLFRTKTYTKIKQ